MDTVNIWYLSDNDQGKENISNLTKVGFSINYIQAKDFSYQTIIVSQMNLFIIDLMDMKVDNIISMINADNRLQNFVKYVIVQPEAIHQAVLSSSNILHIEFLDRPINKREFLLLIEKTVIVEKYRETMKSISTETEARIEAYESILHIHKNDLFETEVEKDAFDKIVRFEKNILEEQSKLNHAIKEFSIIKQKDIYEMKKLLHAEQMLDQLQEKEIRDAKSIINAQESVMDFSKMELTDCKQILMAHEMTDELSREEALKLHNEVYRLQAENLQLRGKIEVLHEQLKHFKGDN